MAISNQPLNRAYCKACKSVVPVKYNYYWSVEKGEDQSFYSCRWLHKIPADEAVDLSPNDLITESEPAVETVEAECHDAAARWDMLNMKLHECKQIDVRGVVANGFLVTRVVGGWIYRPVDNIAGTVFVPEPDAIINMEASL